MKKTYLDHNATTPLLPEVKARIAEALETYGNPSSLHWAGRDAKELIESTRYALADLLKTTPENLIFTSSATESNTTVLKSIPPNGHIITTTIEHSCILKTCETLEKQGSEITYLPVNSNCKINSKDLESAITETTKLISIMLANNETGTIQPLEDCIKIANAHNIPIHTDAVQAFGKIPFDLEKYPVDYLSLSGHKFGTPKGIGILYAKDPESLTPIFQGGHHETGLRAGTQNTLSIAALETAAKIAHQTQEETAHHTKALKEAILSALKIPGLKINGDPENSLPNTLNITIPGKTGESIMMNLDLEGIAISTGSACSTGSIDPSHTLLAMGLSEKDALSSIRISLGTTTTESDIAKLTSTLNRLAAQDSL